MASTTTIPPPSSSSQSQPQLQTQTKTQAPSLDKYNNTNPLIHNVALGVTPLALLALCLPPRRMDLRTVMLGGVALWGTNQLTRDYSGQSFTERFSARAATMTGVELPSEKAKQISAQLREDKERRARVAALRDELVRSGRFGEIRVGEDGVERWTDEQKRLFREAYERVRREEQEGKGQGLGATTNIGGKEEKKNVLEKIWMGDAEPDWKEKRDEREKEALQEGGVGYWGLITEQIAEVWSGGAKKDERKSNEDVKKS